MLMEIYEWAQQLKSLAAGLSQLQKSSSDLNILIFVFYALSSLSLKPSRCYALLGFLFCLVVAYTPIYDYLSQVQYYSMFAIIYAYLTSKIVLVKARIACCLLSCFQVLMAWDSFANADVETYIWTNYETIVCLLHALIIGSFYERDFISIKRDLGVFIARMRHILRYSCDTIGLWYYCSIFKP